MPANCKSVFTTLHLLCPLVRRWCKSISHGQAQPPWSRHTASSGRNVAEVVGAGGGGGWGPICHLPLALSVYSWWLLGWDFLSQSYFWMGPWSRLGEYLGKGARVSFGPLLCGCDWLLCE